jgi:methylated-DNA-[protein]-cysteine S-methyltransferase
LLVAGLGNPGQIADLVGGNHNEIHVSYPTKLSGVQCVATLPVANNFETDSPPPSSSSGNAGVRSSCCGRQNVATNVAARTSDYQTARQVGWGRTTTYGALAKELGAGPEAARDVGQAMARNPVALIIPCHRVLAAGGKIGGFSAPGGSGAKIRMLALEGVRAEPPRPTQRSFAF